MPTTRIKFCGLRRAADVTCAIQLGASFVGFVFAPASPRALGVDEAEQLLGELDTGAARRVGVFQDQGLWFVRDAARRCRLDLVQLHGRESNDFAEALDVPVIVVLRAPPAAKSGAHDPREPGALPGNTFAVLIDAQNERGQSGGLGRQVGDAAFAAVHAGLPAGARVFLAGGLTPENVAARVAKLHPYAVDVSSGVESAPGVKDAQRMQAFVEALKGSA